MIPKNSWCDMQIFVTHNQNIFENPNLFAPSQWENPTDEQLKAILPFAVGQCNCQGQALANTELHLILAKLCRNYELMVKEEGAPEYFVIWKPVGSLIYVKTIKD